jgi:hypothetical protein
VVLCLWLMAGVGVAVETVGGGELVGSLCGGVGGVVLEAAYCPGGVAIVSQHLLNSSKLGGLAHGASGEEMGTSGEGVDGRAFMVERLGAIINEKFNIGT